MSFVQFCCGRSATKDFIDLALLAFYICEWDNREILCKINYSEVAFECDDNLSWLHESFVSIYIFY